MARQPDWYRVKNFADFHSELAEKGSAPESDGEENIGSLPEKFDDDSYTLEDLRRTYEAKKAEIGDSRKGAASVLSTEAGYQRKVMLEYFAREFVKIVVIHNQTDAFARRDRQLRLSQK